MVKNSEHSYPIKDESKKFKGIDEHFNTKETSVGVFDDEDIVIPKINKKKKVGKSKEVTITFRHNRTFELHIGQEVMRFEGRETKQVDKDVLEHPAFIQARKYFITKGV